MSLISDNVKKNADKCETCPLNTWTSKAKNKSEKEKTSILYKNTHKALAATMKASCNACPYRDDFVKVHGVTPVEFYFGKM